MSSTHGRITSRAQQPVEPQKAVLKKMSLLGFTTNNWNGRKNHFNSYTDVEPIDEAKPSLSVIANQKNLAQKLNGWKIIHVASHFDDLANSETEYANDYKETKSFLEGKLSKCRTRGTEKDFDPVIERVEANCQVSQELKEKIVEAKTQMLKLLEHKAYVTDIIQRNVTPSKKERTDVKSK